MARTDMRLLPRTQPRALTRAVRVKSDLTAVVAALMMELYICIDEEE